LYSLNSISYPLKELVKKVKEIGKGKLDERVPIIRNDEIGEFSSAGSINSIKTLFVFRKHTLTFCEPTKVGTAVDSKFKNLVSSPSDSWMFFTTMPI